MSTRWRLRGPALAAVLALSALLAVPFSDAAVVGADTAAEQRDVKRQRAAIAGQIDTLKATDAEVSQALTALEANVRSTQAQLADAQKAVEDAEARAAQAEQQARETEARIDGLRREVVAAAVDAYMAPEGDQVLEAFRESSASEARNKQALRDVANGGKLDAVEEFRTAQRALEDQRDAAELARADAEQRRQGLSETMAGYQAAQAEQQRVAAEVSDRLNDKLAEAQALADLDKELADKLAAEQAAIARQLAAARAAAPSSSGGSGSSSGGGGGGGGPVTMIPQPAGLTTVRGITVANSIASNLAAMLEAASADGIHLTGSGYRDSSRQIALRRQNCGTSDYAVYQMPPDSCRPPTAIPGRSNHERGTAIDFAHNGSTIQSRSSPAFRWLAANAGRYGFRNLPSEPWHWSVDGQ